MSFEATRHFNTNDSFPPRVTHTGSSSHSCRIYVRNTLVNLSVHSHNYPRPDALTQSASSNYRRYRERPIRRPRIQLSFRCTRRIPALALVPVRPLGRDTRQPFTPIMHQSGTRTNLASNTEQPTHDCDCQLRLNCTSPSVIRTCTLSGADPHLRILGEKTESPLLGKPKHEMLKWYSGRGSTKVKLA